MTRTFWSIAACSWLVATSDASAQACKPVSERTHEVGCWIIANADLGKLPAQPMFWHLDVFPSRAAAERARTARGTVVNSLGKVWLLTIEAAEWRPSGGERVARIGALPLTAETNYAVQYMEAVFTPGMTAPAHRHSGPEAWYTLTGETCLETPEGKMIGRAGGSHVIVPAGPPMHLTATGKEMRRALVVIVHDVAQPPTTPAHDWTPRGLCSTQDAPTAHGSVRPGLEVFVSEVPAHLRGKRAGLITNHAASDRAGASAIDLIAAHTDVKLVALFAAEHGIRGSAAAGEKIVDGRDAKTGVPIYSLYMAEDRGPTPEMLKDVEALLYDLPEVGGRTWTYVSTMALSMQAAAKLKIPFVVLDRPNPIGGEIVEGALLDPAFKSFVGMYPIPARHGMTVGELATFFNKEFGIGVDLIVIRTDNWRRSQWFTDTGLPWRNPSPNLRSPAALNNYPGTVYFEGTNLTEGRGTDRPFEQIGAPWLDAPAILRVMNARQLPGVRLEAITMAVEPGAAKFPGQTIPAIRFVITDREAYRPVRTALLLIDEIRRQHPKQFEWGKSIDRLTGSDKVRKAIESGTLPTLLEEWDREAAAFRERRKPFLLYE